MRCQHRALPATVLQVTSLELRSEQGLLELVAVAVHIGTGARLTSSPVMLLQSPGRWYSYRVHGGRIMRFQAPPPPGRKEGFQFLVYGDMGDPHHRQAKAPGWVIRP